MPAPAATNSTQQITSLSKPPSAAEKTSRLARVQASAKESGNQSGSSTGSVRGQKTSYTSQPTKAESAVHGSGQQDQSKRPSANTPGIVPAVWDEHTQLPPGNTSIEATTAQHSTEDFHDANPSERAGAHKVLRDADASSELNSEMEAPGARASAAGGGSPSAGQLQDIPFGLATSGGSGLDFFNGTAHIDPLYAQFSIKSLLCSVTCFQPYLCPKTEGQIIYTPASPSTICAGR